MSARTSKLLAALLVVCAAPLAAQGRRGLVEVDPSARGGFWASIGGAAGIEKVDLKDGFGYSNSLTNPVLQLKIGGTINQNWRLGAESFFWFNSYTDQATAVPIKETVGHVALIAQYYPSRTAGFFIKAGPGIAFNTFSPQGFDSDTRAGLSLTGGLGYEVRVGRNVAIVPTADFVQQYYSGSAPDGFNERFINLGLSVQFQSGRRF